jgi:protein SCO1/2
MKGIILLCSWVLVCFCTVAGCKSEPEKHYQLQGEVISVNMPRKIIIVKHGEIPGLMPAMTMSYAVAREKEIATLQPGDKITADLVVSESKGHLEKIVVTSKVTPAPVAQQHTR